MLTWYFETVCVCVYVYPFENNYVFFSKWYISMCIYKRSAAYYWDACTITSVIKMVFEKICMVFCLIL